MNSVKRFFNQVPLLILWLMLCVILWGFVFTRITDTDRTHKIVICVNAETPGAAELEMKLDVQKSGDIRMIQVKPFTYAMLDSSVLHDADLYIVQESEADQFFEWFDPLPESLTGSEKIWKKEETIYGVLFYQPEMGSNLYTQYISFRDEEGKTDNYFLFFGKNSLHIAGHDGAVDDEALHFARVLLSQEF